MTPEEMAALHARAFPDSPWSAAEFARLTQARGMVWMVNRDKTGLAFVQYVPPEAELLTLAVDPAARRRGVATDLLRDLFSVLPSVKVDTLFLEVAEDNAAACALYLGESFDLVGRRAGYYARAGTPAVDALIMRRRLPLGHAPESPQELPESG